MFKNTQRFWDVLGEILAITLVVTWAIWIIDVAFPFINSPFLLAVINFLRTYGSIALIGIVGLEAMSKRNFILQTIFLALLAIVIIFSFFPETFNEIVGSMQKQ